MSASEGTSAKMGGCDVDSLNDHCGLVRGIGDFLPSQSIVSGIKKFQSIARKGTHCKDVFSISREELGVGDTVQLGVLLGVLDGLGANLDSGNLFEERCKA